MPAWGLRDARRFGQNKMPLKCQKSESEQPGCAGIPSPSVVIRHRSLSLAAWARLGSDSRTGVSCWLQQALRASSLSHVNRDSPCAGSIWHSSPLLPHPSCRSSALSGLLWESSPPLLRESSAPLLRESSPPLLSSFCISSSAHLGCFATASVAKRRERVKWVGQRVCDRGIAERPGCSGWQQVTGDSGGAGLQMAPRYHSRSTDERLLRKSLALATETDLEMLQNSWAGFLCVCTKSRCWLEVFARSAVQLCARRCGRGCCGVPESCPRRRAVWGGVSGCMSPFPAATANVISLPWYV